MTRARRRLALELERMDRVLRALRRGPLAPGEVRCGRPHALPTAPGCVPVPTSTLLLRGCPRCGARL